MNQLEVTKVVKLVLYLTLFTTFVCSSNCSPKSQESCRICHTPTREENCHLASPPWLPPRVFFPPLSSRNHHVKKKLSETATEQPVTCCHVNLDDAAIRDARACARLYIRLQIASRSCSARCTPPCRRKPPRRRAPLPAAASARCRRSSRT